MLSLTTIREPEMPWTAASGRTYRLALLDTNALSEIVKRPRVEGAAFVQLFISDAIVPCFTPYSLAELHAAEPLFAAFLEFFGIIPIVVTKPWELILDEEVRGYDGLADVQPILNAFTPFGPDDSYDLRSLVERVFDDSAVRNAIQQGDTRANSVLDTWRANAENFESSEPTANALDAHRFVEESGLQSLGILKTQWVRSLLDEDRVPDLKRFPSLSVMLYSLYWRFWDPSWNPAASDVFDIQIVAVVPYMDIIITEKRQAEIFRKIRSRVPALRDLSVMRLKDLRAMSV